MQQFELEKNHVMEILKTIEVDFIGEPEAKFEMRELSDSEEEIEWVSEHRDTVMSRQSYAQIEDEFTFEPDTMETVPQIVVEVDKEEEEKVSEDQLNSMK